MRDVIQCHADLLYLKGTLRLPPEPITEASEQLLERMPRPAPPADPVPSRLARWACVLTDLLRRHLDRHAPAAALAGRRSLRRIGG